MLGMSSSKYAEKRFPKGITLGFNNYDEYLSFQEELRKLWIMGAKNYFSGKVRSR